MGVNFFFIGDCRWLFFCTFYTLGFFFLLGDRPILTHPLCLGFALTRIALNRNVGGWCWLDNVQRFPVRKWIHFGDPGKRNNVLLFCFVHNPVWVAHFGRHASFFAFSVASRTNLVGHNILTSFVDRHKYTDFYRTSMTTEQVGVQFSQCINYNSWTARRLVQSSC